MTRDPRGDTQLEEAVEVDMSATQVVAHPALRDGASAPFEPFRLGRYTVRQLIGKGGMAEVFLATQDGPAGFEKTCVIKRMRRALVEEPRFVEMFLREARVAARLNHPNVVQIFELGEAEQADARGHHKDYFIAMEFLDGLSLYRAARRSWAAGESVPMEVALRAIADTALGLHHAHTLVLQGKPSSLVHRDVSPDNVILTRDGIAKVLDFGIAKGADLTEVTGTGEVKGKIPFMSPEQLQGAPLDGRSDLWSLGVTFYWLLTGRRPFDGGTEPMTIDNIMRKQPEPPRALNPLVPAPLDAIVMRLLEKDRERRMASGAELADKLLALLGPSATYSAAAAFVAHVAGMPDAAGAGPISALTCVAARPESQWLKRLGSDIPELQHLVPALTSTGSHAAASASDAPPPAAPAAPELPKTGETITGLHTGAFVPSAKPYAIAAGTALAAVLGVAAFLVLRTPDGPEVTHKPPAEPRTQPGGGAPTPEKDPSGGRAAPAPAPVEAATQEPIVAAPPLQEPEADKRPARAARRDDRISVKASAPARVAWKLQGKTLGTGNTTLKLPPGTTQVTAVDGETGGVITLPIKGDSVAFSQAKTGTLVVRARPWAEVKLGAKNLGTTPLDPLALPEGRYELTLVREDKTKRQTVEVKGGDTVNVNADMR